MVFHNRTQKPGLANWPAVIRNRQPQNPNFYGQVSFVRWGAGGGGGHCMFSIISWAIEVIKITTKCSKIPSLPAR